MKRVLLSLLVIPLFTLTACFEIVEQVSLKEDGSGEMTWILNLSQSKDNIRGLLAQDSIMGKKVPQVEDIEMQMTAAESHLRSMDGISQVNVGKDFNNYVFKLSFNFSSVAKMDRAMVETIRLMSKKEQGKNIPFGNFVYDGKSFARKIVYDYDSDMAKVNGEARDILSKASFTAIYRFDKLVSKSSNPQAKISPSKKAVMLKMPLWDAMQNKGLENTLSF